MEIPSLQQFSDAQQSLILHPVKILKGAQDLRSVCLLYGRGSQEGCKTVDGQLAETTALLGHIAQLVDAVRQCTLCKTASLISFCIDAP